MAKSKRRSFLKGVGYTTVGSTLALSGCLGTEGDGEYPSQDIRWIVPFGAGGLIDGYSRIIAEHMPEYMPNDVEIVVENITGGQGLEGTSRIINAEPDGYTMGGFHGPNISGTQVIEDFEGDVRDLEWVGRGGYIPQLLVVNSDTPYESLQDLQDANGIDWALVGLGEACLAIPSIETLDLNVSQFVTGYDSGPDKVPSLVRGEVDAMINSYADSAMLDEIDNGALRPLLVFDSEPADHLDGVPTVTDEGYEELDGNIALTHDVGVTPDTDPDRVETLVSAFDEAVNSDEVQSWSEENFNPVENPGPEQVQEDIENWVDQTEEYLDQIQDSV